MTPALHPGDTLGYFQVQSPLAAGGMSLVWKGRDKLLDRDVAIKQVASGRGIDESVREQFRREADIQKRVSADHPNLVKVYDFVEEERGLFIVMEYVDGSSLDRTLTKADGPLPVNDAVAVTYEVTKGLAAIHEAGVLHRDLKPSNILLPREGGVKICDFGLATYQAEQDLLTLGTARYMAPELFTDQNAEPRADIYSLGVIAYEMLVGRPAFEEAFKTVLRDQRNQALRWMKWHTNQRLTAPALTKLNPQVPEQIGQMVERMMAKDPIQRIDSAPTLMQVIERALRGEDVQARSDSEGPADAEAFAAAREPTAPLPKRSRMPYILAAELLVVLLAVGIWWFLQQQKAEEQVLAARDRAVAAFNAARELEDDGELVEARAGFARVLENWGLEEDQSPQWQNQQELLANARARHDLTQARLIHHRVRRELLPAMQLEQAAGEYDRAAKLLSQAAATLDPDVLRGPDADIRSYSTSVDKALEVARDIENNNFDQALLKIPQYQANFGNTEDQRALFATLKKRIATERQSYTLQQHIDGADAAYQDARYDEARQAIAAAFSAGFRDSEQLQQLKDKVDGLITYRDAVRQARQADDRNNHAEAIGAFRRLVRLYPDDADAQLQRKYDQLYSKQQAQNRMTRHEAEQLMERAANARDIEQKERLYRQADRLVPGIADQQLADLAKTAGFEQDKARAEAAFAENKWQEAIDHATRGLNKKADNTLADLRKQAQVRLYGEEADALIRAGNLAEAERKLRAALGVDPMDRRINARLDELIRKRDYMNAVAAGDQAMAKGDFGDAQRHYRDALAQARKEGYPTGEAENKIKQAEYRDWLIKADRAMDNSQLDAARAALTTAERTIGERTAEIETRWQRLRELGG